MNYNDLKKPITINNNKLFTNFTSKYLLPQATLFDDDVLDAMNNTHWLAFAIADRKYPKYDEFDNKLFALATTKKGMQYWLDNKEYYLYKDGQANKVVIIFELPVNNRNDFLQGNYSKLYDEKMLGNLFKEYQKHNDITYPDARYSVLTKKVEQKEVFQNRRNKDFNLNPTINVTEDQEYEYPPILVSEIFNYDYGIKV